MSKKVRNKTVLIMAGGTGGHIYPALAVALKLVKKNIDVKWLGTKRGLEAKVVPLNKIPIYWIDIKGLRGKSLLGQIAVPFKLVKACWQARKIIKSIKPDCVVGMGGFAAGPGALVAKWLKIPLIIHEQNSVPGLTNKLLAPRADKLLCAFPGSFKQELQPIFIGNPLRKNIIDKARAAQLTAHSDVKKDFKVLVLGGSLGAHTLNQILPVALSQLQSKCVSKAIKVWHQTGVDKRDATLQNYSATNLIHQVDSFIGNMAQAYAWADLVVCRAGAMTVAELAAMAVPAILVPYPYAVDDHQTKNAEYLSNNNAALIIQEQELTEKRLTDALTKLLTAEQKLQKMSEQARKLAHLDATKNMVDIILETIDA